jgi:RNase P subunit RPR2
MSAEEAFEDIEENICPKCHTVDGIPFLEDRIYVKIKGVYYRQCEKCGTRWKIKKGTATWYRAKAALSG